MNTELSQRERNKIDKRIDKDINKILPFFEDNNKPGLDKSDRTDDKINKAYGDVWVLFAGFIREEVSKIEYKLTTFSKNKYMFFLYKLSSNSVTRVKYARFGNIINELNVIYGNKQTLLNDIESEYIRDITSLSQQIDRLLQVQAIKHAEIQKMQLIDIIRSYLIKYTKAYFECVFVLDEMELITEKTYRKYGNYKSQRMAAINYYYEQINYELKKREVTVKIPFFAVNDDIIRLVYGKELIHKEFEKELADIRKKRQIIEEKKLEFERKTCKYLNPDGIPDDEGRCNDLDIAMPMETNVYWNYTEGESYDACTELMSCEKGKSGDTISPTVDSLIKES